MAITVGTDGWVELASVKTRLAQYAARLGDANSPLTDAAAEGFITKRFHQINAVAKGQGLTVAELAADTEATAVLGLINELGAAYDIIVTLNAMTGGRVHEAAEEYRQQYEDELEKLRDGSYKLGETTTEAEDNPVASASILSGGDHATNRYRLDSFGVVRGRIK